MATRRMTTGRATAQRASTGPWARSGTIAVSAVLILLTLIWLATAAPRSPNHAPPAALPPTGRTVALQSLSSRRSIREYADRPLHMDGLAQLLWAAQGRNDPTGTGRTAPSAGGLYPLTVYVVAGHVSGLAPGVYRYEAATHRLAQITVGDRREVLGQAALDQEPVRRAPAVLLIAGDYGITAARYGDRAERYVALEAGHAGQNVALAAAAGGLSTVAIGAFEDDRLADVIPLPSGQVPLCLWPVGVSRVGSAPSAAISPTPDRR